MGANACECQVKTENKETPRTKEDVCECQVEIERDGILQKETFQSSSDIVNPTSFRQKLMNFFKVGSPLEDLDVESDEDESWMLLGLNGDDADDAKDLEGADVVNLNDYRTYRLTPRTSAGS
jgi:hypothetical protein